MRCLKPEKNCLVFPLQLPFSCRHESDHWYYFSEFLPPLAWAYKRFKIRCIISFYFDSFFHFSWMQAGKNSGSLLVNELDKPLFFCENMLCFNFSDFDSLTMSIPKKKVSDVSRHKITYSCHNISYVIQNTISLHSVYLWKGMSITLNLELKKLIQWKLYHQPPCVQTQEL